MLVVWVEETPHNYKWWVIIERQDKSFHWTLPVLVSEGNDFLNLIIQTAVDTISAGDLLKGLPFEARKGKEMQ